MPATPSPTPRAAEAGTLRPPRADDPRWAYLLINGAALSWSTNLILGRLLHNQIGPFTLTAARFTVAGLAFTILALRRRDAWQWPGRQWPFMLGMGFAGVFGFSSLLYAGLRLTAATNAAIINGTGPIVISLLSSLLLREGWRRRAVLGALISFGGVAILAGGTSGNLLLAPRFGRGDLLILAAMFAWGLYSVMSRVVTRTNSALAATMFSTWFGLPLLYPAAIHEWLSDPPSVTPLLVTAVVYLGIFPGVLGFMAWNEGVRRVGPGRATGFYNMVSVFGAALGVLLLGESLGPRQLLGGAMVITGGLTSVWTELWKPST